MSRLQRFISAQETDYPQALRELRNGRKQSHWMWYIFPQIAGLGSSSMALKYGIQNLEEAVAYLQDDLLSGRLITLTGILVNDVPETSAEKILGHTDALKFRSSMTLFREAALVLPGPDKSRFACFGEALRKFYEGQPDDQTLALLGKGRNL